MDDSSLFLKENTSILKIKIEEEDKDRRSDEKGMRRIEDQRRRRREG